jgi:hypothetical protein
VARSKRRRLEWFEKQMWVKQFLKVSQKVKRTEGRKAQIKKAGRCRE